MRLPQDSPRYLGAVPREVDPTVVEQLEEAIARHDTLLGLFNMPGWTLYEEEMRASEAKAVAALESVNGASTLDDIYAARECLALVRYFLALPERTRAAAERDKQELFRLRQEER